jgi:hypothetical protein
VVKASASRLAAPRTELVEPFVSRAAAITGTDNGVLITSSTALIS